MEARAKLLGHPIHPMLIAFPLGLLGTSVVFDLAHLVTGSARFAEVAFWMIVAGVVSGLLAALFGVIDWLGIPRGTRAWRIGLLHGASNVVVLLVFAASAWLRADAPDEPGWLALALSLFGVGLAAVAGWLGGELVNRFGVGVHDGANLDAPSSLSRRPL